MIQPETLREYARYPSSAYVPIHQDTLLEIAARIEALTARAAEKPAISPVAQAWYLFRIKWCVAIRDGDRARVDDMETVMRVMEAEFPAEVAIAKAREWVPSDFPGRPHA